MYPKLEPRFVAAVNEMGRVIYALILREIKTRFGRYRLGYIWAVLEPLLFVSLFLIIYNLRGRFAPAGMGLEVFLITGIVPFFLFRHIMSASLNALDANRQLLTFPQVQIHDIILARFLLETATYIVIFIILIAGVHLLNIDDINIESPPGVLAGIIMMALFGLGLGLCLSSLVPIFPATKMISEVLLGRPLFFVSGVFFSADMMPPALREYLLINPLFQTMEFTRASFSVHVNATHFNPEYTFACLFIILFLGLLMQRALYRYGLSMG